MSSLTPLIDLQGADRLEEIASLQFSITFVGEAAETHRWRWMPGTGEVTGGRADKSGAFVLAHAVTPVEVELERMFLTDTFWLDPALHVRWARGTSATLEERNALDPVGRRQVDLHYPSGGYSPGDTHELFLDDAGTIVAWHYRPTSGPVTLSAEFSDRTTVGPLRVASTRQVQGAPFSRVVIGDLSWTPVGAVMTAQRGGRAVVAVTAAGCRLGPVQVGWASPPPPLARLPEAPGPYRQSLVLEVREGSFEVAWSNERLAFEDVGWLASSEVLGCDFGALQESELRAVLRDLSDDERGVLVAVLWGWAWGNGKVGARAEALLPTARRNASACAVRGDCDPVIALLPRVR